MANSMAMSSGFGGQPIPHRNDGSGTPSTQLPPAPGERRFLSELELASRWGMSPKTLTRWRCMGSKGPVFAKFSKKVAYPLDGECGVLDFEQSHLYVSTSERAVAGGRQS